MVPYFLLASSCGALDVVKYFIESGQKPNIRYLYNEIVYCDCMNHMQWNLSNKDTYRATANILNIYFSCPSILHFYIKFGLVQVSLIQGCLKSHSTVHTLIVAYMCDSKAQRVL